MRRAVVLSCVVAILAACSSKGKPTVSADQLRNKMLANLGTQPAGTTVLFLNISGVSLGSVSTNPPLSWTCDSAGDSCGVYATPGIAVTFTASPNSNAVFTSWGGQCSGNGACAITTSGVQSVLAVFQPHTVTAVLSGLGSGSVTSSYGTPACGGGQCVLTLPSSGAPANLTLTAVPASNSYFAGWYGANCGGTGTCTVPTGQAQMVNAVFQTNQTAITVWVPGTPVLGDGGGGTINATGTLESSCSFVGAKTCTFHVNTNQLPVSVTLSATPNNYSAFTGWGGECSGTAPCTLNITQPTNVTAVFLAYELGVNVYGYGSVSSSPGLVSCSDKTTPCTIDFATGSPPTLTLTATPAPNYTFLGWSGACTGTGTCQISTTTPSNSVSAFFQIAIPANGSAPIIQFFAANPSSIPNGGVTTLSWIVAGATTLNLAYGSISTPVYASPMTVKPTFLSSSVTFTLTATNANGTSTKQAIVTLALPPTAQTYNHQPPWTWVDPTLTQQCQNMVQVGGNHACGGDMSFYMPLNCTQCHGNGSDFTPDGGPSSVSCAACHLNAFASTTCGGFGVASPCSCDLCHTPAQITNKMGTTTSQSSCTLCHGDATISNTAINAAPGRDTLGNTSTSAPFVGAHAAHLNAGVLSQAIACTECHTVPPSGDTTHFSTFPSPVAFNWGPLASSAGVTPSWNGVAYTCTNYCHGATLSGGTLTKPTWTVVNGTQAACGTCHGAPPPSPHPAATLAQCHGCHSGTVNSDGTINVAGGLHVDGVVEITGGTCTSCHGNSNISQFPLDAAPPYDTLGNSATSAPGVGAHQIHLVNTDLRSSPIACTECHVVPGDTTHSTEPLNLTWGLLASACITTNCTPGPSFNTATLQCTNYCHGSNLGAGGSNTNPQWNKVDGTQAACGTCHGLPPPPSTGHVQLNGCGFCHCGYTTGAYAGMPINSTTVNLQQHMDANVEVECE